MSDSLMTLHTLTAVKRHRLESEVVYLLKNVRSLLGNFTKFI